VDKKWWTLAAVCTGTFMLLLDVTIVNVALPEVQAGLKAGLGDLQWIVDAYALSLSALLLTAGSLADLFGRRRLFTIGLVIFTLGSLLCGLAQDPLMLILSRAGQGVGGAIMFATSLALLASTFQGKERGTAFGIWGGVTGIAVAVGPILGGLLTTGISWRAIFIVNVPIGIIGVFVTVLKVEESRQPHAHRPDWLGVSFLTGGLIGLVYGLIRAGEISWSNWGVAVSLIAGGVLLIAFVVAESRVANPMFDLSLFKVPTFVGGSIAAFAMNASLFAMLLYLVLYLQDVKQYSALGAGLRLLVMSAGTLATSTIAGRLTSHVPIRWLIGPGLALVALGLFLMGGLHPTTDWTHLIPGFIIGGAGAGLVNPPLASTAVGVVEPRRSGMASGINTTFRQVGIATSIAALGTIFTRAVRTELQHSLQHTAVAHQIPAIITQVKGGDLQSALALVPAQYRGQVTVAAGTGFSNGINDLLIVTGVVAVVGALAALLLIRTKDFAAGAARSHQPAQGAQAETGSVEVAGAGGA
jgi:EmrB/QacA subfamily drug resistance transporter